MPGIRAGAVGAALALLCAGSAAAWDRGDVDTFAVMPDIAPGVAANIEGLTVGPDGRVYTPSFGFNNMGAVSVPNAHLFVFHPDGRLCANATIAGSSPHPLGLEFNPVTGQLVVLDFGAGTVLGVETPACGATSVASTVLATAPSGAGLNALTFDTTGNAYISDSFLGVIWKMPPHGGTLTAWSKDPDLLGNGLGALTPPFGANGVEFNTAGTTLFVANTAYHQIIQIPVNPDGSAGAASVFVTGINAPDGIRIDSHDNIWICANQQDEIDVVDPTGKVIAKLGDFNGVAKNGTAKGFLFPASPAFSQDGKSLLVANLALYLPFAGVANIAIDSGWTLEVSRYSITRVPARIPEDDHESAIEREGRQHKEN
jgi:DNA-binding beta-propeller fold protein YncE